MTNAYLMITLFALFILAGVNTIGVFCVVLLSVPALLVIITSIDVLTVVFNKILNKNIETLLI